MRALIFLMLCGVPLLIHAAIPQAINITGVRDEVLVNVQNRIQALYKDKSVDSQALDSLRFQVAKALYPYGYFKPQIAIDIRNMHTVYIHIIPGPKLLITAMNVSIKGEGSTNVELKKALQDLPIHVGDPLSTIAYEKAKDNLTNAAEHQGYLHATFEISRVIIDEANYSAQIILLFNTGLQYYFGDVHFKPTSIAPDLLHRYVPFKYGQPYASDAILELNRHLANSGYFHAVNVDPVQTESRNVPIEVDLEPVKRLSYSIGAGYGTDTGPRGRLGLNITPVNSAGHKFNAAAQGSLVENALQAQYSIPGANPITDQYNINGGFTNLHYNVGNSNAILVGVAQQHSLSNYQRTFSLNGLNERYKYTDLMQENETLLFPKAAFTWRKISDPLFSPSGYNLTLTGLVANRMLLSDVNLAQISINAKAAIMFDALRTRIYLHAIEGFTQFNQVNQLPLSLALLLGGAENLKGYSFNAIGPGKVTSYMGIEIQKETFNTLYVLGFFDQGAVYNPSFKQNNMDAGMGVMWVSPVGPIKISVAQAVTSSFQRIPYLGPKLVISMGPDL